jgi:hypothetical protein
MNGQCLTQQSVQGRRLQQKAPPFDQSSTGIEPGEGKDVIFTQPPPEPGERLDAIGIGPCGKVGTVDSAYRSANHHIASNMGLNQGPQHTHLHRTQTAAASEYDCGFGRHGRSLGAQMYRMSVADGSEPQPVIQARFVQLKY